MKLLELLLGPGAGFLYELDIGINIPLSPTLSPNGGEGVKVAGVNFLC
jgi:hypothetical protein